MLCHLQRLITVVSKFVILYVCTVLSRIHLILYGLCNKVTFTMQNRFSALSLMFLSCFRRVVCRCLCVTSISV